MVFNGLLCLSSLTYYIEARRELDLRMDAALKGPKKKKKKGEVCLIATRVPQNPADYFGYRILRK